MAGAVQGHGFCQAGGEQNATPSPIQPLAIMWRQMSTLVTKRWLLSAWAKWSLYSRHTGVVPG